MHLKILFILIKWKSCGLDCVRRKKNKRIERKQNHKQETNMTVEHLNTSFYFA